MTRTIALAGQKGGAGKSTLAVCLAVEGMQRGQRVLLVDADPQGTARTWGEVAAEGNHPCPPVISLGAAMHRPGQLDTIGAGYDLVLIDCPPRHGEIQRSALMAADQVLIPCGPSGTEVWALGVTIELLTDARVHRPELPAHLVLTKVQPRTAVGASARASLEATGIPVLDRTLGFRVAYQEAVVCGRGVTEYEPEGQAAREVRRLYDELFGAALRTPAVPSRRKDPVRASQAAPRPDAPAATVARGPHTDRATG